MKLRVKFSKTGVLKYIGHLDTMRYFQKAFRRTDIRVKYSTGFSPHMIMSFAQALGVGVESLGEYFDVEVEDDQEIAGMVDKLNAQMAEGFKVIDIVKIDDKATNAMASVAASRYEIDFYKTENPVTPELIEEFRSAGPIEYTKKVKTGEITFNIKDFVFELEYRDKGFYCVVDSSSAGNLKPKFLVEVLLKLAGKDIEHYPFHILRIDLLKRDSEGRLVSLDHE